MLDQRRSFSFSSLDFNSSNNSASLFSSSSSDDFFASNFIMYDTEDDDGDNDDGAYIEINLDPPRSIQKTVLEEKEFKNSNTSEVELRISFSSTGIPPTETTTTTTCGTTQHAQGTTTTTTMSKPRRGRLFVSSLARIVNEFIAASSVKTSNSVKAIEANNNVAHENGPAHVLPLSKSDCAEMIRTRKDCTMVPSKNNGIMNFIVKLKYKNIPSMLISMVTPKPKKGQIRARQPLLQRERSSTCRGRDPMNNNNNLMKLKTRNHSDLNHQDVNHDKSTSSSVAAIINFKAMRGVLDALIVKTSRYCTSATTGGGLLSGNKHNSSKSCPSSIKSSPMHNNVCEDDVRRFYSRDNSVQAAIAHCKKSFGTQAEFDFHI
ncbi:hypothetical protein R3W88_027395 [Solanum pinnatisectum]|uniref:Uncharacterized protein n=1 Tax=Solanum pinnatisectum TaxID=50273 RepID=A0AAV9LFW5_9SOLN|nr:hypothetical protein R3W88_027395 [Solanum pinnatisectum]